MVEAQVQTKGLPEGRQDARSSEDEAEDDPSDSMLPHILHSEPNPKP